MGGAGDWGWGNGWGRRLGVGQWVRQEIGGGAMGEAGDWGWGNG